MYSVYINFIHFKINFFFFSQAPKGGRKRAGHATKICNDVSIKVEPVTNVADQHSADICSSWKSINVTCTAPTFPYNKLKVTRAITRASNKRG